MATDGVCVEGHTGHPDGREHECNGSEAGVSVVTSGLAPPGAYETTVSQNLEEKHQACAQELTSGKLGRATEKPLQMLARTAFA